MNKTVFPNITIAIPTFNEEKRIDTCLKSIFRQNYPYKKLEVIVVDDYSQDKTVQIAQKYPIKILYNGAHDGEVGKMIAFKKSKGEFFYYLDADCELKGKDCLKKLIKPLMEDRTLAASFTRNYARKDAPALERYYSMHPTQCDPIYEFFSPSIANTVVEKRGDYQVCEYSLNKIPPAGHCVFRREFLWPLVKNKKKFMELDFLVVLVENGFNRFAYVPQAGVYHHHVSSLVELLKKRSRNVQRVYLPEVEKRKYRWFDLKKPGDLFKIFLWIIYAHLFFPSLIRGIFKSVKYKDWAGLYEPIVTLLVTDVIIFSFLSNKKGRKFIQESLSSINE